MLTRHRRIATFAIGCGLMLLLAPAAQAQYAPLQRQPQIITLQNFSTKGEYVGMAGPNMKCVLDGTLVTVQFDKNSKFKVTGTATPDFLAPGMYVQFKGTFDRYGKGTEPIKEVQIFTPDANNQPGAYALGSGAGFADANANKKKSPPAATTAYQVGGRISAAHRNTINVECGKMKFKAEIAPDATVKLDTSDLSWASPGDKIDISGAILGPGHALGLNLTIQLAKPLTGKKTGYGAKVAERLAEKLAEKNKADKADKSDKTAPTTDKKIADPKAAGAKVADAKGADPKVTDSKATEPKVADPKGADSQVVDPKAGDAKPDEKASDAKKLDDTKTDDKGVVDKKTDDKKLDNKTDAAK